MQSVSTVEKKRDLSGKELKAIELRYQGLSSKAAVTRLNKDFPKSKTSVKTYDNWFYKNGRLYEAYADFADDQQKMMKAAVQARLANMANKALDVLEAQVTKTGRYRYGMIANMAANSILERTIGKADADSGKIVVVRLVDPVKPTDVPPGYNADGTPKTTVADAVAASDEQAGTDRKRAELMQTIAQHQTPRTNDPGESDEVSGNDV